MALFVVEASCCVYKNRAKEYEQACREADKKQEKAEPGLLVHVHTKVSENDEEVTYKWVEVYESYEDFQRHLESDISQTHLQKINNGILSSSPEVIIYCDWTDEQKAHWHQKYGINFTYPPMNAGFFRQR